ncbi:MAG: DUF493 domain-containing protein [Sphingobacterium composti]|uniref:DUF493 domain-containing protein n=1 Tax=Sphingobacterium composti TaxID=363260 RepID=UPI00135AF773|nr:DUF493 domain-containing protein [Sphingobacterium composti Ten et al. 2007 non Yoo et al. 2007]
MSDFNNINIQDISDNNGADFYNNFRQKLIDIEQFPSIYTFKFILPADQDKKADVEKIFEHPSTKISSKESSTGKYNSLTVETYVNSADDVIDYYKKVSTIEKVIMM